MKLNISDAFYRFFYFSIKRLSTKNDFKNTHILKFLTNKIIISQHFFSFQTLQELKTDILNYTPMNENVSAANILLIGQIGAGKSSVLNTVNSIYRGKITSRALSGSFEHSLTTTVSPYCQFVCYFVLSKFSEKYWN